ncbi:unannotated protein [freshwater metagenome]|uniref:Unannotated protein n=1 Tax=freshwater metagenome TaxID=449393 RepID=A0A6J6K195_9ZZZZ
MVATSEYPPALVGAEADGPYEVDPIPVYDGITESAAGVVEVASGRGVPSYVALRVDANAIVAAAFTMSPCKVGWVSA